MRRIQLDECRTASRRNAANRRPQGRHFTGAVFDPELTKAYPRRFGRSGKVRRTRVFAPGIALSRRFLTFK